MSVALSTSFDPTRPGSIRAERVWKRFRKDQVRPFLADRARDLVTRRPREDRFRWVLRDIDFEVEPGQAVGVVGANGAGKSTLLKLLTRVSYPNAGAVTLSGRVGSIIELRGGFHPDLTGRENTYLQGALLGLTRSEVNKRFSTIVEFADIGPSLDRQLKHYSSGMQTRLGFAVAAFLQPDVLLVDEVLAVGDAWFQQRCLDRMREVLQEGTTLVLVSHDLASIEAVCRRGLWLENGLLVADGPVRDVLTAYRHRVEERVGLDYVPPPSVVKVRSVAVGGQDGSMPASFRDLEVSVVLDAEEERQGRLHLGVSEGGATPTFLVSTSIRLETGATEVRCRMGSVPLPRGDYSLWLYLERGGNDEDVIPWHAVASFVLAGTDLDPAPTAVVRPSPVHVAASWERERLG